MEDNAIECVVHGCDVLNKRGFARPYVLSEHTLVIQWIIGIHHTMCAVAALSKCHIKQSGNALTFGVLSDAPSTSFSRYIFTSS